MTDDDAHGAVPEARTPGERLREARIAQGLDLGDVASRTRIPLRHLEAIEADDFAALPSITYSTGFAKAYARAVGLDEVALGADVRRAIAADGRERENYRAFEPADPARTPPRALAWTAAIVAVLLLVGYGVWRNLALPGDAPPGAPAVVASAERPTPVDPPPGAAPAAVASPRANPPANAPVILTATDRVWLRISDASGGRLFEREMAPGERYEVPADANGPRIITGRPQAISITVGGRQIAPLGPADRTISDVPVDAASLSARPPASPAG